MRCAICDCELPAEAEELICWECYQAELAGPMEK